MQNNDIFKIFVSVQNYKDLMESDFTRFYNRIYKIFGTISWMFAQDNGNIDRVRKMSAYITFKPLIVSDKCQNSTLFIY